MALEALDETAAKLFEQQKRKKVLFAYDGSPHSELALRYFESLLAKESLYEVLMVSVHKRDSVDDAHAAASSAADAMRAIAALIGERHVSMLTFHGSPKEVLCQVAIDEQADLVVLGARGRGAVKRFLLGSVSTFVLNHVAVDALIVLRNEPRGERRALVAVDGSELAEKAFKIALKLARGLTFYVLRVVPMVSRELGGGGEEDSNEADDPESVPSTIKAARLRRAEQAVEDYVVRARDAGHLAHPLVAYGDARAKIVECAQSLDIELVVLGAVGTSNVGGVTVGSVTAYVLNHSPSNAVFVAHW